MTFTATFNRPVNATLIIRLADGTEIEADEDNIAKFGLFTGQSAYEAIRDHMQAAIDRQDTGRVSLANANINPIRVLAEVVLRYPHRVNSDLYVNALRLTGDIERALQQTGFDPKLPTH